MKKNILLLSLLFLLSGCALDLIVIVAGSIAATVRMAVEKGVIKDLHSECLNREKTKCFVLDSYNRYPNKTCRQSEAGCFSLRTYSENKYAGAITANESGIFITDGRRIARFNPKNKKITIIDGSENWKIFQNTKDERDRTSELRFLQGTALIKNKLYFGEATTPYLSFMDIVTGRMRVGKNLLADNELTGLYENALYETMISDGSDLYFIDKEKKRIIKLDIPSNKIVSMRVFDKSDSDYIYSLLGHGGFIYFSAYESGDYILGRLNPKNGRIKLFFRNHKLKIKLKDDSQPLPKTGKSLITIAQTTNGNIRFRVFDKHGRITLDKKEKELKNRLAQIEELKRQLEQNKKYENVPPEIINSVKRIIGHPLYEESFLPQRCLNFYMRSYIATDGKNIYFNDSCSNIRRYNIATGKVSLLAGRPEHGQGWVSGMAVSGNFLYIMNRFYIAGELLIRRVNLKSGETSYLAGVLSEHDQE